MRKLILSMLLMAALAATMPLSAARKKMAAASSPGFSYYLLALSWAPDFCAQAGTNGNPAECGTGKKIGFVVHGLWPQGDSGRGPENCGGSPVANSIVQLMLNYIPTESLIQHEWAPHGTCSGLAAADYFAAVRKARDSVTIPDDLKEPARQLRLSPSEIEAKFAAANPRFPKEAFRVSCYRDGELQEARICFNRDLSPRACGTGVGQCSASPAVILPVR